MAQPGRRHARLPAHRRRPVQGRRRRRPPLRAHVAGSARADRAPGPGGDRPGRSHHRLVGDGAGRPCRADTGEHALRPVPRRRRHRGQPRALGPRLGRLRGRTAGRTHDLVPAAVGRSGEPDASHGAGAGRSHPSCGGAPAVLHRRHRSGSRPGRRPVVGQAPPVPGQRDELRYRHRLPLPPARSGRLLLLLRDHRAQHQPRRRALPHPARRFEHAQAARSGAVPARDRERLTAAHDRRGHRERGHRRSRGRSAGWRRGVHLDVERLRGPHGDRDRRHQPALHPAHASGLRDRARRGPYRRHCAVGGPPGRRAAPVHRPRHDPRASVRRRRYR